MSRFLTFLLISATLFSCSTDSEEEDNKPNLEADFELRLNGTNFNNQDIQIDFRRFFVLNDNRVEITAGDEVPVHFFGFYLPFPVEEGNYTMVEGSKSSENTVFYALNQSDTYYTTNGTIVIEQIVKDGDCEKYTGSVNVNLALSGDPAQVLNITGNFEFETEACD